MYEPWENLTPGLAKAFRKTVAVGELTISLSNLSGTDAMVLTNRAVYLLRKKWWSVKCVRVPLQELEGISLESRDRVQLVTKTGERYTLTVGQESFPKAAKAVNRVLELIEKLQKPCL